MEYCSNALSWIVDTLAQGSTFKPPRPPPTLRGTSEDVNVCHRLHSFESASTYTIISFTTLLHRGVPVFYVCLMEPWRWHQLLGDAQPSHQSD